MEAKCLWIAAPLLAAVAPVILAQNPDEAPPHPKIVSRRVITSRSSSSYLGVGVCDIEPDRAKALKLSEDAGVEIKSVDPHSPAQKAGLKVGDVVLEYNGQKVQGNEQFARLVRETPAGRTARLKLAREGNTVNLMATIGTRPAGAYVDDEGDGFSWVMPMPPMPAMPNLPNVAPVPPLPPMPDVPNSTMSWRSGMLGIESESLSSQLAEFFGVKEGVLVRSVGRNTPAEKAGIKAGDVIIQVDGARVTSPHEVTGVLRGARSKKSLTVVIVREKREMNLTVEIDGNHGMRGLHPVNLANRDC